MYFLEDVKFTDIHKVFIHSLNFTLICQSISHITSINSGILFDLISQSLHNLYCLGAISTPLYITLPLLSANGRTSWKFSRE